jgi:hypothetical protein
MLKIMQEEPQKHDGCKPEVSEINTNLIEYLCAKILLLGNGEWRRGESNP